MALQPLDRRVQRQGKEDRDHHPGQDVPRDPDHLEGDRDRDDRRQQGQDRVQPEANETLRDHVRSIATAPDVQPRTVRAGGGNRTRVTSLEGWSSTIELRPRRLLA